MVTLLREAGAIVMGRTNLSQLCLFAESRNPVVGQTANPWSAGHTPGGSSGGEGAAIAAGLSPLGVGTDIGGSIRVPAHFCGIAGFKPTLDRLPMRGIGTGIAGQEAVRAMCGPMARTVAEHAPITIRTAKQELNRIVRHWAPPGSSQHVVQAYTSQDFKEGIDAFLGKRKPRWQGK